MCKDFQSWVNTLINWFRESWKTMYAKYYILWCILYNKKHYIIFFCDEKRKAQDKIIDVANHLQANKKIIIDFWKLYKDDERDDKIEKTSKKRIWDFETEKEIKVEAMWIWEIMRGKVYWSPNKWEKRPDLVLMDDIDTLRSVNTIDLIEKWYNYIKNEVYGAISDDSQFIFLYNTIKDDWVWPRLYSDHKDDDNFVCMKIPILDWENNITRPQRYSMEDIEYKKTKQWLTVFNQNYMLIPYTWESIIRRDMIKYYVNIDKFDRVIIWVDPAISTKEISDSLAIVVVGVIENNYYIIEAIELKWEQKKTQKSVGTIEMLYKKYNASTVVIETTAFQKVYWEFLRDREIVTKEINPTKDKVTRLQEKEWLFEQWRVYFKKEKTKDLVEQLITFPNSTHDDLVDAMVYWLSTEKKPLFVVV